MGSYAYAMAVQLVCPFTTFLTSMISEKFFVINSRASSYFRQGNMFRQDWTCEMYLCQSMMQCYISALKVSFVLPASHAEHSKFTLSYLQVYERKGFLQTFYHFKHCNKVVTEPILASLTG